MLILGGIDLSVGATMGLTSVIGAVLMAQTLDPAFFDKSPLWGTLMRPEGGILAGSDLAVPIGVLVMLVAGTCIGWLNGFAITRFNLAPFMVTLVTSTFFSAFALWLTQSRNISGLPDAFVNLGKGDLISIYFGAKLTSDIARRDIYAVYHLPIRDRGRSGDLCAVHPFAHGLRSAHVLNWHESPRIGNLRRAQSRRHHPRVHVQRILRGRRVDFVLRAVGDWSAIAWGWQPLA
ncbi:MAG: hypothetical protein IPO91_12875 [Chloroflexi bacterium]|nr:hypothetical protein [Chloroflexota bacterium]